MSLEHQSTGHYNGCSFDVTVSAPQGQNLCGVVSAVANTAISSGATVASAYDGCTITGAANDPGEANHLHINTPNCP